MRGAVHAVRESSITNRVHTYTRTHARTRTRTHTHTHTHTYAVPHHQQGT